MSKKIQAIAEMVFHSQQSPEELAKVIAPLVTDVKTAVAINGSKVVKINASKSVTSVYTASVVSQFGDKMTGSITWSVSEAEGVSISDGTLTVANTATEGKVTITARSESLVGHFDVTITK